MLGENRPSRQLGVSAAMVEMQLAIDHHLHVFAAGAGGGGGEGLPGGR